MNSSFEKGGGGGVENILFDIPKMIVMVFFSRTP